jgi:hypothetical protein
LAVQIWVAAAKLQSPYRPVVVVVVIVVVVRMVELDALVVFAAAALEAPHLPAWHRQRKIPARVLVAEAVQPRAALVARMSHRTFAGQGREICIVPVRKLVEILWVAGRAVAGAQQKQQQRRC